MKKNLKLQATVPVAGVGQAPWDEGVLLLVRGVTLVLPISAAADPPLGARSGLAVLHVVITVNQLAALISVFQCHHLQDYKV